MKASRTTIRLSLSGYSLDDETIMMHTRNLSRMLSERSSDIVIIDDEDITIVEGHKGDPITVGTIVLALVTSGSAVALIKCLESVFARDKDITIRVESGQEKFSINAKNIGVEETQALLKTLAGNHPPEAAGC